MTQSLTAQRRAVERARNNAAHERGVQHDR